MPVADEPNTVALTGTVFAYLTWTDAAPGPTICAHKATRQMNPSGERVRQHHVGAALTATARQPVTLVCPARHKYGPVSARALARLADRRIRPLTRRHRGEGRPTV